MNLPVSYKLPRIVNLGCFEEWLTENDLVDSISYEWITNILSFENEEDAIAFSLKFGIPRHETTVEKMLNNEKSNN